MRQAIILGCGEPVTFHLTAKESKDMVAILNAAKIHIGTREELDVDDRRYLRLINNMLSK